MSVLNRVPVREQDPKVRATNFDEVCLGYNMEEAMEEVYSGMSSIYQYSGICKSGKGRKDHRSC